jgi:predicted enzyme related to lactoylglutathione lyase
MFGVVVDCEDPSRLASFWQSLVGGVIDSRADSADWKQIHIAAGLTYLAFQRVPERKGGKNRVHLDYLVDDLDEAIRRAIELGATTEGSTYQELTNRFQVMRDPEDNEFCLVQQLVQGAKPLT